MLNINNNKIQNIIEYFKCSGLIDDDDEVQNMFENLSFEDTISHLKAMQDKEEIQVPFHSIKIYEAIEEVAQKDHEAHVLTKYKTVEKKVLPIAAPLPGDSEKAMSQ